MNNLSYWKQTATPWVSVSVLAGGLTAACLLFVLVGIESKLQPIETRFDEPAVQSL